jgi:hypothetical protein
MFGSRPRKVVVHCMGVWQRKVFEELSTALVWVLRDNDGRVTNDKGDIIGELIPDGIMGQSMSHSKSGHIY